MKRFFLSLILLTGLSLTSCTFDDSDIWNKLNDHENRIVKLEELCKQLNTNIVAMQSIVNALETHDYITNVSPIRKDGVEVGYTISFAFGDTITIYHGQNGADGKDGYTPKIGVMKDTDGIYYWTLDGEWLLDGKGNKIKAVGIDGKDGISPLLRIEDGYWYVSYDNGTSWLQLCKAAGADGEDGQDGTNGTDGKDGVTPLFKIESNYWYVSYNNGTTWTKLGKATGEDGVDGTDGKDGVDGTDGTNGKDGNTPYLKIENGYWYVSYDNGKTWTKLGKATGEDGTDGEDGIDGTNGKDGKDGQDGVTPRLKIENGYWYVSYDNGRTWTQLGKATGEDGKDGQDGLNGANGVDGEDGRDGDSFFKSVTQDDENVYFTLADGTVITIPKAKSEEDLGTIIYYTTRDGNIVEPNADAFDGTIISNTYKKGKGAIKFDRVISKIGAHAFNNCFNLTTITIPDSITLIEERVFNSEYLKAFYGKFASSDNRCLIIDGRLAYFASADLTKYNIPSSVTTIGDYALNHSRLTAVYIPNTVTSIGEDSFSCSPLQSVVIPDSVIYIADFAFTECNLLSSVVIGNKVTSIGQEAFARCSNLKNITIPASVVVMNFGVFSECTKLESVTIGSGITEIGGYCFANCNALKSIYCKATIPPAIHCTENSGVFPFNAGMRIYVPMNSYNAYTQYTSFSSQQPLAQTNWYGYKSYIEPYNF